MPSRTITHPCKDTIKRIRQQLRSGRQLEKTMFPLDVVVVVRIELAEVFNAVHELGHTRRDVVIAIEPDSAISYCFRPKKSAETSVRSRS